MPSNVAGKNAVTKLLGLYSFVKAEDVDETLLQDYVIATNEQIIGLYFNTVDNFIFFTSLGVYLSENGQERAFRYSEIEDIELPEENQLRVLKVALRARDIVFMPILNETEGLLDLFLVFEYLMEEIYWPFSCWDSELPVASVTSPTKLAQFLGELGYGNSLDLITALRSDLPNEWQLKTFGIDPEFLNNPDTWRLLAAFLSVPQGRERTRLFGS